MLNYEELARKARPQDAGRENYRGEEHKQDHKRKSHVRRKRDQISWFP